MTSTAISVQRCQVASPVSTVSGVMHDGRGEVQGVGRLEAVTGAELGCSLDDSGVDVDHVETLAAEEVVVGGKRSGIPLAQGPHAAL